MFIRNAQYLSTIGMLAFGAVACGSEESEPGSEEGQLSPDDGMMGPDDGMMGPDDGMMGPDDGMMGPDDGMMGPDDGMMGPDDEPPLDPTAPVSMVGTCEGLDSGYVGDGACMIPPPPELGFQVHVGPSDYTDPEDVDRFIMLPDQESSECWMQKTENDQDVYYNNTELSGRPGTHHIINSLLSTDRPDGWGACESFIGGGDVIGRLGGASRAHMPLVEIAPENEALGYPVAAHTQAQYDMHYFNTTGDPILREFWMNVWYIDEAEVEQTPHRITGLGGLGWFGAGAIQPGSHETYQYSCDIPQAGRIIQLLGHTHAHGIRETAWIETNGERTKVFEQYDYLEPQIFNYNSVQENPAFSENNPGAFTGLLDVAAGSKLVWECEIQNSSDVALSYINDVQTGEMCNIWGATVGTGDISCTLR